MKKIVYFMALCLVFGCKNSQKKEMTTSNIQQDARAKTYETPSNNATEKDAEKNFAPMALQKSTASGISKDTISETKTEPENVFFLAQNTTTSRKIIRTAQVKTKVKNTEGATYQIEQMAQKWRGFVTANNLENRLVKQEEVPFSTDSMLQIRHSEAVNTLMVRVPNLHLDTFLANLSRIYVHLDYRRVNANDLTATFLTNQLKANIRQESSQRIAAASDEKGKRLNDIVNAETSRVQLSDEAIAQKVQNEETDYDIAFSTVQIEIYEDAVVSKTVVPYISATVARGNLGFRCQQALANGWSFLLDIFVGILNLWAFILLIVLGYVLYRRVKGLELFRKALDTPQ
jgi:hypothetical protein